MSDDDLLGYWSKGVELFNRGEYWEAHAAWEFNWRTLPDHRRDYIQGLIQACGAFVLFGKGRVVPAVSLCRSASEKIASFQACRGNFEIETWIEIPGLRPVLAQLIDEFSARENWPAWGSLVNGLRASLHR